MNLCTMQKGTASDDREFMLEKPPPEFPPARLKIQRDNIFCSNVACLKYCLHLIQEHSES